MQLFRSLEVLKLANENARTDKKVYFKDITGQELSEQSTLCGPCHLEMSICWVTNLLVALISH